MLLIFLFPRLIEQIQQMTEQLDAESAKLEASDQNNAKLSKDLRETKASFQRKYEYNLLLLLLMFLLLFQLIFVSA